MAYRNIYISQEEYFAAYYGTDKYYEGFVIGYGYVYMKSFFSTPPHWNGFNSTPIKPDVVDTFCQMGYERLVDTSNEAVKLSWQGLFENDVAEFCVKEGMTFKKIASIFDVTVRDILSWNDINDPDKIYVGQKIIIKKTNTKLRDNLEFASGVAGLTCSTTQFTGALLYNYHMRALFNSNFEMMRYNNLNVAIDNGGKIWRGTNNSQFFNKALTQNIQNPTRYFPKAVPCLKLGGKIFGGAGLYFSYRRGYDAIQKNDMLTMIDAEMDFLMGCVGFIPYGGWITSGLYFLCKPAIRFNAEHVVERQIELGILGMAATMASK